MDSLNRCGTLTFMRRLLPITVLALIVCSALLVTARQAAAWWDARAVHHAQLDRADARRALESVYHATLATWSDRLIPSRAGDDVAASFAAITPCPPWRLVVGAGRESMRFVHRITIDHPSTTLRELGDMMLAWRAAAPWWVTERVVLNHANAVGEQVDRFRVTIDLVAVRGVPR